MAHQTKASPGKKVRLQGVDAARGLALIGMMAIHIMPGWDGHYEPTAAWSIFAGRGAALFALLAGVSLAFSSGRRNPVSGPQLKAARTALLVRAILIALLGLAMGYVVIEEAVILAYYGVMFLLAVPFMGWSARSLAYMAGGVIVVAPVIMQAVRDHLPAPGYDPTFTTIFTEPVVALSQLVLTGPYPALPWLGYIFAGMAIGRLDLRRSLVQVRLLVGGAVVAVGTWAGSALLLGPLGVRDILEQSMSGAGAAEAVHDIIIWGPAPTLPTESWWWLVTTSPYSSTPFELLHTIGTSMVVLGVMLLLCSAVSAEISTLVAMGTMTLTLYTGHLLLLATGLLEDKPGAALFAHIGLAAGFALVWRHFKGQGPLEKAIAVPIRGVRGWVLQAASSGEGATNHPTGPVAGSLDAGAPPPEPPTETQRSQ